MQEDDEAFEAFERSMHSRSVLESEQERVALGYPADVALQTHGASIEDDILRKLEREAERLRFRHRSAEILAFPPVRKPDGA